METIPCKAISYTSPTTCPTMPTSLNKGISPQRCHFKTQHKAVYAMKVNWAVPLRLSTSFTSPPLYPGGQAPIIQWTGVHPHPQWYLCQTTCHHIWQDSNVQDHSTSHEMGTTALWDRHTCNGVSSNSNINIITTAVAHTLTWRSWLQLYQVAQVTWPWDEQPAVLNWNRHWNWINGTRDM